MFGYICANAEDLTQEEKDRYRAVYCGLCRTLGKRHGLSARFGLTYDMTFLILFLSSMYEPKEEYGTCRCMAHPWKKDHYSVNVITEYAADMTVALVYHKCMDDWRDEHKIVRRGYAAMLKRAYQNVSRFWPEQVSAVERGMEELAEIEADPQNGLDEAANCFGRMLGTLFGYRNDLWQSALTRFGYYLGQFIYTMDAVIDCEEDKKKSSYNPVLLLGRTPEEMREPLMMQMGQAAQVFERLPMIQDGNLLRNIIYSGVWQSYNRMLYKRGEEKKNG